MVGQVFSAQTPSKRMMGAEIPNIGDTFHFFMQKYLMGSLWFSESQGQWKAGKFEEIIDMGPKNQEDFHSDSTFSPSQQALICTQLVATWTPGFGLHGTYYISQTCMGTLGCEYRRRGSYEAKSQKQETERGLQKLHWAEECPQNSSPPRTSRCDLIWKLDLDRCN